MYAGQHERGRDRSGGGHQRQRAVGTDEAKQPDHRQRADAGAEQVEAVDPPDRRREAGQREPGAGSGEEEGHREQQVEDREPEPLPCCPDQLERVERHGLGYGDRDHGGEPEQGCGPRKGQRSLRPQPVEQRGERAAAGTVAEQRQADHHAGEMVPVDDRQDPGQQDLEGERPAGDQTDCQE